MIPVLPFSSGPLAIAPVMTDYSFYPRARVMGGHVHRVYHVVLVVDGAGVLEKDRDKVPMAPGDMVIINPGERHVFHTVASSMRIFACNFYLTSGIVLDADGVPPRVEELEAAAVTTPLGQLEPSFGTGHAVHFGACGGLWAQVLHAAARLRSDVTGYLEACAEGRPADHTPYALRTVSFLTELVSLVGLAPHGATAGRLAADPLLLAVDTALREDLSRPYHLAHVAQSVGRSPSYLCTYVSRHLGMTLSSYHTRLRISRACELLRNPSAPISRIALELGFCSVQHFSASFRKAKLCSPREYRKAGGHVV